MGLPLSLTLTQAGLDALVDAQNGVTTTITITQLGLSEQHVTVAPTLDALPGEFKRLDSFAGFAATETIIHMTAHDAGQDTYDLRAIGLFLEDGTLFAAYSQATPIFRKVDIATFLVSFDVLFSEAIAGDIAFGDASFLYPPATEQTKGVAEIATQSEADEGTDDFRIVTPRKLATRLAALLASINAAIAAIASRKITGAGLATGGGDLTADRAITVTEASTADVIAGTSSTKVLTPRRAANLLPAGAVFAFAMNAAPAGYLKCNGAAVSRAAYPALFAAIGTSHGPGDGATTFNLPDLRGEFVRGWDDGRGIDAGRAFGSPQADDFKSHKHTFPVSSNDANIGSYADATPEPSASGTATTNATGGDETRPRNIALLYCIKI